MCPWQDLNIVVYLFSRYALKVSIEGTLIHLTIDPLSLLENHFLEAPQVREYYVLDVDPHLRGQQVNDLCEVL